MFAGSRFSHNLSQDPDDAVELGQRLTAFSIRLRVVCRESCSRILGRPTRLSRRIEATP